jgi:hypothetical protein
VASGRRALLGDMAVLDGTETGLAAARIQAEVADM